MTNISNVAEAKAPKMCTCKNAGWLSSVSSITHNPETIEQLFVVRTISADSSR